MFLEEKAAHTSLMIKITAIIENIDVLLQEEFLCFRLLSTDQNNIEKNAVLE